LDSIEKVIQLFDFTRDFRITGGEVFLYPEINKVLTEAAKYKDKFEFLSVVTNATFIPNKSILRTIANLPCNVVFRIDNYGKWSTKTTELIEVARSFNIEPEVRFYNEYEMAFGGWLDLGDYTDKGYTAQQKESLFKHCKLPTDCGVVWNGKFNCCPYCASGYNLGEIGMAEYEYVDLFDNSLSVVEKRLKVSKWNEKPYIGCSYCNGYDTENSPRIPAAEQMEKII
jgi:hypothetical protein